MIERQFCKKVKWRTFFVQVVERLATETSKENFSFDKGRIKTSPGSEQVTAAQHSALSKGLKFGQYGNLDSKFGLLTN